MDGSSLQFIKSQSSFVSAVIRSLLSDDGFVIVCGDTGSGRSVICEQVINATDRRAQGVFIPCQEGMSLTQLRQMFLRQFAPAAADALDPRRPLTEALTEEQLPGPLKVLAVIDNADRAPAAFCDELRQAFELHAGHDRLSCLLTAAPDWAQRRAAAWTGSSVMPIPALSMEEAMNLCLNLFRLRGRLPEFRGLEKSLPSLLAGCDGNIDRILATTEELMKDPTGTKAGAGPAEPARERSARPERPAADPAGELSGGKKNGGTAALIIAGVAVVLVLLAAAPLLAGGGYESILALFGAGGEEKAGETAAAEPQPQLTSSPALAPAVHPAPADLPPRPRLGDRGAGESVPGVERPRLSERTAAGTEPAARNPALTRQTVLEGRTLESIERERPTVRTAAVTTAGEPMRVQNPIQADNRLRKGDIARREEQEQRELIRQAEAQAASAQAEAAPAVTAAAPAAAIPAPAAAPPAASPAPAAAPAARPAATAAAAAGDGAPGVVRADRVPDSGKAVAGTRDELLGKKSDHYTLQVVAGHSRDKIADASSGIAGRYWIYETRHNSRPWFVLVTGEYRTVAEANAAIRQLPPALVKAKPFPKSFGRVKQEMTAAR